MLLRLRFLIYDRGRGPELKRIRITVYDVIPWLEAGWHPSYIPTVLPITTAELERLKSAYLDPQKPATPAKRSLIDR